MVLTKNLPHKKILSVNNQQDFLDLKFCKITYRLPLLKLRCF